MADKIDWRGACDGTPSSKPTTSGADMGEVRKPSGDAWKGMDDATPASSPSKSGMPGK